MSYWYVEEDVVYSILGIEPAMRVSDIIPLLPEHIDVDNEKAAEAYYEALEEKTGEVESAVERVLDDVRAKAKEGLDDYLIYKGVDPEDYDHLLWYKNMLDDFAQETLFGLRGGVPEYNEINLTYLPDMFAAIEEPLDENFFNVMVAECDRIGQDSWDDWVVPTVQEARQEALKAVTDTPAGWGEAQWKEAMDNGVVLVYDDIDDSFNIYYEGHLIEQAIRQPEEANALAKEIARQRGLDPEEAIFTYNYLADDTVSDYEEEYSKHMFWTPRPKPDPRQTHMPFAASTRRSAQGTPGYCIDIYSESWTDEDREFGDTTEKYGPTTYVSQDWDDLVSEFHMGDWEWNENYSTSDRISQRDPLLLRDTKGADRAYFEEGVTTYYTAYVQHCDGTPLTQEEINNLGDDARILGTSPQVEAWPELPERERPMPSPDQERLPFEASAKSYRGVPIAANAPGEWHEATKDYFDWRKQHGEQTAYQMMEKQYGKGVARKAKRYIDRNASTDTERTADRYSEVTEQELLDAINESEIKIEMLEEAGNRSAAREEKLVLDELLAMYGDDEYEGEEQERWASRRTAARTQSPAKLAQAIQQLLDKTAKEWDDPSLFADVHIRVGEQEANRYVDCGGTVALTYDGAGYDLLSYQGEMEYMGGSQIRRDVINVAAEMGYFAEDYSTWATCFYPDETAQSLGPLPKREMPGWMQRELDAELKRYEDEFGPYEEDE